MEIRWLGQSAFEIKTSTGTILCDPAGAIVSSGPGHDPNTVLVLSRKEARPSGITDSMAVFDRPGEYEVAGICVRGVGTPVSEKVAGRGLNTVFLVEAEGN